MPFFFFVRYTLHLPKMLESCNVPDFQCALFKEGTFCHLDDVDVSREKANIRNLSNQVPDLIVIVLCIVVRYFMSILVLQSS